MKKIVLLTLSTLCLSAGTFASESTSKWQAQPIVIDGDMADWGSIPRFFDSESNVQYEFRNDAQNLYVVVRTTDRTMQAQMAHAGFSVRLKIRTENVTKCAVNFTAPKMGGMPPMDTNQGGVKPEQLADKSTARPEFAMKDSAVLEGFEFTKGVISAENQNSAGICFAKSKGAKESTVVELQIPLREIFGANFSLEKLADTSIQFQVVINELSGNSKKSQGRMGGGMRGRGGMPGGGGGGQMGGMPGGGEIGGGGEMGGGDMGERPDMQGGEAPRGMSMSRRTISTNFKLSLPK